MSTQAVQPLFSTPVYQRQPHELPATRRLLVSQTLEHAEVDALLAALQAHAEPLQVLALGDSRGAGEGRELFAAQAPLEQQLRALLRAAPVGTRLYLCGDESFIWQCCEIARQAGLQGEEVELFRLGARRRLYCVHCFTLQDIAADAEVACACCGVRLLVRAHFSQRLGAYMGVCVDPDNLRGEARP
jgi:DNA-directed RNA polymerase subunit RPC12/RpoP